MNKKVSKTFYHSISTNSIGEQKRKMKSSIFFFFLALLPTLCFSKSTLLKTECLNGSIVSGEFELGFFKLSSSWYLGLWFQRLPKKTYVWVANRDSPLNSSSACLKISENGFVLEQEEKNVWSANISRSGKSPVVAELLADGNFILKDVDNKTLWQRFDFPTDTLLPGMELGINRSLRSWRTLDDPSSGLYTLLVEESRGLHEVLVYYRDNPMPVYRCSTWNELKMQLESLKTSRYSSRSSNINSRLILNYKGLLQLFMWNQTTQHWDLFWYMPKEQCDEYNECGSYGYCDQLTTPICNCLRGFEPRDPLHWHMKDGSHGCVRKTNLSCGSDGFLKQTLLKLPDSTTAVVIKRMGLKDCQERCLKDCSCMAFTVTSFGCVFWTGRLLDIKHDSQGGGGHDLYIRLATADLIPIGEEKKTSALIIGLTIGISVVLLLISFVICCVCLERTQKKQTGATPNVSLVGMENVVITNRRHLSLEHETEDFELRFMDFKAISTATDDFSDVNKLGIGGFGVVYKGRLLDGQAIAVKRLSKDSHQGVDEFMNEVRFISKLAHRNLVRLLGCCVDGIEKLLVYEYLENGSLDCFLFDKSKSCKLNWQTRLDIIKGIARGIMYLHQDSRLRIVHRDLKTSNVLLDKEMTPKITDFGTARTFARDETEANTNKLVGTFGYMSPEYAKCGIYSTKSDVFSFGVMVLEIVSGKRNTGLCDSEQDLPGHVWNKWKEGEGLETIDPLIRDFPSSSSAGSAWQEQILRCIQIGLVCVQDDALDRPEMASVMLMFEGETVAIPQPKMPGFYVTRSPRLPDNLESETVNQVLPTISEIEPL